jgi:hypothetical protein
VGWLKGERQDKKGSWRTNTIKVYYRHDNESHYFEISSNKKKENPA